MPEDRDGRRGPGRRRELGVPPAQVAVAWLRDRPPSSTAVVPIIGPRNVAQLDDYLAALDVSWAIEYTTGSMRSAALIWGSRA